MLSTSRGHLRPNEALRSLRLYGIKTAEFIMNQGELFAGENVRLKTLSTFRADTDDSRQRSPPGPTAGSRTGFSTSETHDCTGEVSLSEEIVFLSAFAADQ